MDRGRLRRVDELIVAYKLEPSLKEIYVEGQRDKILIQDYTESINPQIVVFTITNIDFEDIDNSRFNLSIEKNNRNRLILLALIFGELSFDFMTNIMLIVDSDFDFLLGKEHVSKYMYYTDYTSLDLYLFNPLFLDRYFKHVIRDLTCETTQLINQMIPVLKLLFCIRTTNQVLNLRLTWLNPKKLLKLSNCNLHFNNVEFIKRYLNKNKKLRLLDKFNCELNKIENLELRNVKQGIHKKDFYNLLIYIIKNNSRRWDTFDREVLEGTLFFGLDLQYLDSCGLFKNIRTWCNSTIKSTESQ